MRLQQAVILNAIHESLKDYRGSRSVQYNENIDDARWYLQSCRDEWAYVFPDYDYDEMVRKMKEAWKHEKARRLLRQSLTCGSRKTFHGEGRADWSTDE